MKMKKNPMILLSDNCSIGINEDEASNAIEINLRLLVPRAIAEEIIDTLEG